MSIVPLNVVECMNSTFYLRIPLMLLCDKNILSFSWEICNCSVPILLYIQIYTLFFIKETFTIRHLLPCRVIAWRERDVGGCILQIILDFDWLAVFLMTQFKKKSKWSQRFYSPESFWRCSGLEFEPFFLQMINPKFIVMDVTQWVPWTQQVVALFPVLVRYPPPLITGLCRRGGGMKRRHKHNISRLG